MRTAMRWILATCLAGLGTVGLVACGDKGSGGGGDASSPVGAWTVDVEGTVPAMLATLPKEERSPEKIAAAKAMLAKLEVTVEFQSGGKMSATIKNPFEPAGRIHTGTWKLEGTKLTVQTSTKDGKPAEGDDAKPKEGEFKDGRITLRSDGPNDPAFVLKRK